MRRLLRDGYDVAMRPSQHEIGPHFNGGAIPSVPNTRSNEVYLRRCKAAGVAPHPARFPFEVPEFFVRFLTTEGQLVYDPFAGSNVTGAAAEALGRRWFSTEIRADYVEGSRYRFADPAVRTAAAPLLAEVAGELFGQELVHAGQRLQVGLGHAHSTIPPSRRSVRSRRPSGCPAP